MPRFFFDIYEGSEMLPDQTGIDLVDDAAARHHAVAIAETYLHEPDRGTKPVRIAVRDAANEPVDHEGAEQH